MDDRTRSSKPCLGHSWRTAMVLLLAAIWSPPLSAAAPPGLFAVFEPFSPTDNELARLIMSGSWRDSCTPFLSSVTVIGTTVRVDAETPRGLGCLSAVSPFAFTAAVGPLEPGSYVFDVYLTDFALDADATPVFWGSSRPLRVTDGPDEVLLRDDRFLIRVSWRDFEGATGSGRELPTPSADTGFFWFFDADNVELIVKVLDGCGINGRYWFFAAAATNVEYTIDVVDTKTGEGWRYDNPLGRASPAVTDTAAFATCP